MSLVNLSSSWYRRTLTHIYMYLHKTVCCTALYTHPFFLIFCHPRQLLPWPWLVRLSSWDLGIFFSNVFLGGALCIARYFHLTFLYYCYYYYYYYYSISINCIMVISKMKKIVVNSPLNPKVTTQSDNDRVHNCANNTSDWNGYFFHV